MPKIELEKIRMKILLWARMYLCGFSRLPEIKWRKKDFKALDKFVKENSFKK